MLYAAAAVVCCALLGFLTWDGALAAWAVGSLTWQAGTWVWATPLLAFFFTSSLLGGLTSRRGERRNWKQVLCNGAAAALAAGIFATKPDPRLAAAFLCAIAAATADTWATEIGTRFGRSFVDLHTMRRGVRGQSGVVSPEGLFAAAAGSTLIACLGAALRIFPNWLTVAGVGLGSCILDSILGAWFQFRSEPPNRSLRFLDNDGVNLASTFAAAAAGYFIAAA